MSSPPEAFETRNWTLLRSDLQMGLSGHTWICDALRSPRRQPIGGPTDLPGILHHVAWWCADQTEAWRRGDVPPDDPRIEHIGQDSTRGKPRVKFAPCELVKQINDRLVEQRRFSAQADLRHEAEVVLALVKQSDPELHRQLLQAGARASTPEVTDADEVAPPDVADDSYLSPNKLAQVFGVPADALRCRLNRWRAKNHGDWMENPDRRPREPKYLYKVGAARPIIQALKATSEATTERAARKNLNANRRG